MKEKILIDILMGIGLCVFSISVFIFSFSLEEKARVFPVVITFALALFSGLIIFKNIYLFALNSKKKSTDTTAGAPDKTKGIVKSVQKNLYPLLISGLCMTFVLLFPKIGFEISAFSLLFITMAIINIKEAIRKIYIAIVVPAVLIAIFYYGLKLRIPLLLENIFR